MKGKVILVGAGCGKDLITVKGLQAVRSAEAIVYDDLIDADVLRKAADGCELLYVGKRSGRHCKTQEEINDLLVSLAESGKQVVRLKGGDSFVFGRGGEELLRLSQHGIDCEVIPGVSSAIAVPEHFGIPVTHRGTAQSFSVITGHTASQTEEDYKALAALKGTLVFLMGHGSAGEISKKLIAFGKDENTKVSVLSKGFSDEEKRVDGVLKDLEQLAAQTDTPAILIIGPVTELHLGSQYLRPRGLLDGIRVTVTGSEAFTAKCSAVLTAAGAQVRTYRAIRIVPDAAAVPETLDGYTWLAFTSSNGVRIFFDVLFSRKQDLRALGGKKIACIGQATAAELQKYGIFADLIPERYTAADLGKVLAQTLCAEDKLLILRARSGSEELNLPLDAAKVAYTDAKIYDTESTQARLDAPTASDYLVFASASGARSFFENGGAVGEKTKIVCIGEATRRETALHTKKPCLTAQKHDAQGILEAIAQDAGRKL